METRHRIHRIILAHAREMRHPLTLAEITLWRVLRNRQIGFKFRRQHPIDRFIIAFYCAQPKLSIEIDGESHFQQSRKNTAKHEQNTWKNLTTERFDLQMMMLGTMCMQL